MYKKILYPIRFEPVSPDMLSSLDALSCVLNFKRAGTEEIVLLHVIDVSLIVIGTHGKGYVEGILWGSVSRNVVEYSDRPVLLIKGGKCLTEGETHGNVN